MPRKNSKVRSRNVKRDRRQKGEARPQKVVQQPRIPVEDMVVPHGKCYLQSRRHGKAIFLTEAEATKALNQAQAMRRRTGSGHAEKRFYQCPEGGCGGYHLTSREAYDNAWNRSKSAAS